MRKLKNIALFSILFSFASCITNHRITVNNKKTYKLHSDILCDTTKNKAKIFLSWGNIPSPNQKEFIRVLNYTFLTANRVYIQRSNNKNLVFNARKRTLKYGQIENNNEATLPVSLNHVGENLVSVSINHWGERCFFKQELSPTISYFVLQNANKEELIYEFRDSFWRGTIVDIQYARKKLVYILFAESGLFSYNIETGRFNQIMRQCHDKKIISFKLSHNGKYIACHIKNEVEESDYITLKCNPTIRLSDEVYLIDLIDQIIYNVNF